MQFKKNNCLAGPLVVCFLILQVSYCQAQDEVPQLLDYSSQEKSLKECGFDKTADAVILLDEASSFYYDSWHLITKRHIRIKILNVRALDQANITILYYSKNKFEFIKDIKALSFNEEPGGEPVVNYVNRKSIYDNNMDQNYSKISFAIPNVKAGTIIEYQYTSDMKNYGGLRDWYFQSALPTIRSHYKLEVPPNTEFAYQVRKKTMYPVTIKPMFDQGQIIFEMNDIPGLRSEPYMDAPNDYLQKIEFQLSGYVNSVGAQSKFSQTWAALAQELSGDENFTGALRKDYSGMDELRSMMIGKKTETEKLKTVYEYVRDHFTWNGYDSKFVTDGLKVTWEKRTGSAAEINLLLVNLLRIFDIECYPLLVAERDHGKIDTSYPFIDRFNKTAAYCIADNNRFILDATQKNVPVDLVPYPLLNTYAFIVDRKKYQLFNVRSNQKFDNIISINSVLSPQGVYAGKAQLSSIHYARQAWIGKLKENEKKFIKETFTDNTEGMLIDSSGFYEEASPELTLLQQIRFHQDLNDNGGFILLNYNHFLGLSKNPFKSEIRFTNINFGYPFDIILEEDVELPAGSVTDDLPKNKTLRTPSGEISLKREIRREGNILKIRVNFIQDITMVPNTEYNVLRNFYTEMVNLLNEPVVVKMPK